MNMIKTLILEFFYRHYYHTGMSRTRSYAKARQIFEQHSGVLRTAQAIRHGIPPATLYAMRDAQVIIQESRGLYRLADVELATHPDLVQVCQRIPKAVVCLTSALDFHELTTQIPFRVTIALPRGARTPKLDYPAIQVVHMVEPAYCAGIENHTIDGLPVRVYRAEKTIADCIKYRRIVGIDVIQEALRLYLNQAPIHLDALLQFAQINRVERPLRRYLEVLV
jgi:hypothetical protein